MKEQAGYKTLWRIYKYRNQAFADLGLAHEILEFEGNILLNEGINELMTLLCGGSATAFDNSNAYIGVGDGDLTPVTGTSVTFTNGSATVTGVGTSFLSQLAVGDKIQLDADATLMRIASIELDTSLTLECLYNDTGGTGAGSFISPTETGLAASSNKYYQAMDVSYPTYGSSQKATWRSTFASGVANFAWDEITVANGNSDSADNLNRLVQTMGTKASGAVWTVELEIALS